MRARRLPAAIAGLLRDVGTPDAAVVATRGVAERLSALALSRVIVDETRSGAILIISRNMIKERFGVALRT